jgi:GNAT superfamily N-acetyltransferase
MAACSMDGQSLDGPRLIRPEELVASQRLDALCFPGFVEEVAEEKLLASHTPPRRGGVQVICHRGVPVSQIEITHSRVNVYGGYLRLASIGSVCTHPGYRGQGLASRLLDYCMHKLAAEGARLVLISGTRGLYTRAGCVTAQDFECVVLRSGQPCGASSGPVELPGPPLCPATDDLSLRPATDADASLCARLYQMEAVHFVRRVEEFAGHFCRLERYPQAEDWIVEVGGHPVAYAFLSLPWEHWHDDAGLREVFEYAGSRVALVAGLAQVMARLDLREMRLLVPWQDVDFRQLLRGRGTSGRHFLLEHTMRIVDLPGLMSDLRPYVRARLTARQRRGLRFEQEGLVPGKAAGDRCAIVRGQERLELDGATMTRLVMGAPDEIRPNVFLGPGALSEIVPALFPLPSFLPGLNYR